MIFTRLAFIVACAGLGIGLWQLALGFIIANLELAAYEAALRRYTTSTSSGQVIDKAGIILLVSIAFGTLAEISRAVGRK